MMLHYSFHPLAEVELTEAAHAYESSEAGTGIRFTDAVEAAISQIRRSPECAPVVTRSVRGKTVSGFPHTVYYYPMSGGIRILAVAHQRRQPYSWLSRAENEGPLLT